MTVKTTYHLDRGRLVVTAVPGRPLEFEWGCDDGRRRVAFVVDDVPVLSLTLNLLSCDRGTPQIREAALALADAIDGWHGDLVPHRILAALRALS